MHLAAVLFDMDGLLIDSEEQWFVAETLTVAALGGVWGRAQQHDLLGSNLRLRRRLHAAIHRQRQIAR